MVNPRTDPAFEPKESQVVALGPADLPRLKSLCLQCTDFYQLVEGQAATEAHAMEIVEPSPPPFAHASKFAWGVESDGKLLAVAELLEGHPREGEWYIGLLLVAPEERRRGLGTALARWVLRWMRSRGATAVRLLVHAQNTTAHGFWERQGFVREECIVHRSGRLEGPAWIHLLRFPPSRP